MSGLFPFNLSPSFWINKNYRTKNKRYACSACPNKTTKRQLKITGGRCLYCKEVMNAAIQR